MAIIKGVEQPLKNLKKWGGGELMYFFCLKVYSTNLMPYFSGNFANFAELGDKPPNLEALASLPTLV